MAGIPLDQHDGYIWMNGEMMAWKDAKIHVLAHGLHYASSCFEGIRAYNGRAFKLREHNERLIESARLIEIALPYTAQELDAATNQVLQKNNFTNAYIRPIVWRGSEQLGIGGEGTSPNVAIAAWVWDKYYSADEGISLMTSRWRKIPPTCAAVQSKTGGLYTFGTVAKQEAIAKGFNDAIMLDFEGYIAECTVANLFFIKDGQIHTPAPDRFLNGITRQTVIELARRNGYTVTERRILPSELSSFDEIFLTGTAAEVMPINRIDHMAFKTNGPVTAALQKAYQVETGQTIANDIAAA